MATRRLKANNKKRRTDEQPRSVARGMRTRSITVIIYLVLAAISVAVFAQTIRYEFVNFDDDLYVYNAPDIQAGLTRKGDSGLAFISQHARNWHPINDSVAHAGLSTIRPERWRSSCYQHHFTHDRGAPSISGVPANDWCNYGRIRLSQHYLRCTLLHVESVAWISERKDVLLALSSSYLYAWAHTVVMHAHRLMTRYLTVVVLFAAGLMSKSMLVSAPIVLLLLD